MNFEFNYQMGVFVMVLVFALPGILFLLKEFECKTCGK